MTNLTINEVYAIGAPIVLAMILFEVLFSSLNNKNLYKKEDTLCTIGLLSGNILMVFAIKGVTLALHFYLFQFKLLNLKLFLIENETKSSAIGSTSPCKFSVGLRKVFHCCRRTSQLLQ